MKEIVVGYDRQKGSRMIRLTLACGHEDDVLLPIGGTLPKQRWCCECAHRAKERANDPDRAYQESVEV